MERPPLTARQAQLLTFIRQHFRTYRSIPTFREMAAHLRVGSTNAVTGHVRLLAKKGYLRYAVDQGRSSGNLRVSIVCDEVEVVVQANGIILETPMTPLTVDQARQTAKRLLEAADKLEGLQCSNG